MRPHVSPHCRNSLTVNTTAINNSKQTNKTKKNKKQQH
jgi:hypothetical protein